MTWARTARTAWGGAREAWGNSGAGGGGGGNVIESYTWDLSYWGSGLVGAVWTPNDGAVNLNANTANALTGRSTSGLTSDALPSGLVDNAVHPFLVGNSYGYNSAVDAYNWTTGDFHVRMLIKRNVDEGTNWYLWRFIDSSSYYVGYRATVGTAVQHQYRAVGIFDHQVDWGAVGGWFLVDWSIDVDGGAGGNTRSIVHVNGVEVTGDDTDAITQVGGAGRLGLMGFETGQLATDTDWLFWGYRIGSLMTLGEHQADAAALGLYTP